VTESNENRHFFNYTLSLDEPCPVHRMPANIHTNTNAH